MPFNPMYASGVMAHTKAQAAMMVSPHNIPSTNSNALVNIGTGGLRGAFKN